MRKQGGANGGSAAASTDGAPRGRWDEFKRGLRARTPLVLLAAGLGAVLVLWAMEAFVASGAYVALPEGRLMRDPNDDCAHIAYRVAELRRRPPTGPAVYILGGSGTLELARSEATLGHAVSAAAGSRVPVITLAASRQTLGQTLAIVDNLPRGTGLVAIGLSPRRLTASPDDDAGQLSGRPLALESPALEALLAGEVSDRSRLPGMLPGVLDFAVSYLRQRASLETPWLTSVAYDHHYWYDGPIATLARKRILSREELAYERPLFRRHAAHNLAALADIVRVGRERGYSVVFFEQPFSPEMIGPEWGVLLAEYRARLGALGRHLGVPIVDVQQESGVRLHDFVDLFHLVESGRDKWTPPFTRAVANVLVAEGIVSAPAASAETASASDRDSVPR